MRLSAEDNGCGLDAALVERIFEPFFTTKGPRDGTGLGLASMAEFVEQAGGAIRVESAPGHGAAFHLYFPIEA
jgi:signal transduction histidine kinase